MMCLFNLLSLFAGMLPLGDSALGHHELAPTAVAAKSDSGASGGRGGVSFSHCDSSLLFFLLYLQVLESARGHRSTQSEL